MIVADENIDNSLIQELRKSYEVQSIRELYPGMDDRDIAKLVKGKSGILITEDKDFGALVFAYNFRNISVIFLRYDKADFLMVQNQLLNVLKTYHKKGGHFFITITKNKTRVTEL